MEIMTHNGPIHVKCGLLSEVFASSMEAKPYDNFKNFHHGIELWIYLEEIGNKNLYTPVATDNSSAAWAANRKEKLKLSQSIDMQFYLIWDKKFYFNILYEIGQKYF